MHLKALTKNSHDFVNVMKVMKKKATNQQKHDFILYIIYMTCYKRKRTYAYYKN